MRPVPSALGSERGSPRMSTAIVDRPLLIGRATVAGMCNVSEKTISRWVKDGRFPKPTILGLRTHRWHTEDVQTWIVKNRPHPDA